MIKTQMLLPKIIGGNIKDWGFGLGFALELGFSYFILNSPHWPV